MAEMIVDFKDIQQSLAPFLTGKTVKIIVHDDEVKILPQTTQKKILKARGILKAYADPKKIAGEKGAWERAVVEKYAENNS